MQNRQADWPEDVFIQISESQIGRALRTKRWKYGVVAPGLDGSSAPGAERYVEEYLYDLLADPYELTNLIGVANYHAVKTQLCARLIERMVQIGEAAPTIEPAPEQHLAQRQASIEDVRRGYLSDGTI